LSWTVHVKGNSVLQITFSVFLSYPYFEMEYGKTISCLGTLFLYRVD